MIDFHTLNAKKGDDMSNEPQLADWLQQSIEMQWHPWTWNFNMDRLGGLGCRLMISFGGNMDAPKYTFRMFQPGPTGHIAAVQMLYRRWSQIVRMDDHEDLMAQAMMGEENQDTNPAGW